MSLIKKRRVFAFAPETTAGTPVSLNVSNGCFSLDPEIQGEIPMHDRVATGSLSRLPAIPGARKGKLSVSFELAGGGSAPEPTWAPLLLMCGMTASSHVYTFNSNPANYSTGTLGVFEGGRYKVLAGAMGTFAIDAQYGQPGMIKFDFEGIWQPPTDVPMIAPPSYSVTPPRFAAATLTIGAFTPRISKFSIEAGNSLKMVEDPTQLSAYSRCLITDRAVKGKLDPAAELVGTWDAYGLWLAGTTGALNLVIGGVANNTITIAAPYLQTANIQEGAREQLVTDDLDFIAAATAAGDNEFSITFA